MFDPTHPDAEIALDGAVEHVLRTLEVECENESAAQAFPTADIRLVPPGAEGSW